jgi:hypothetical protein
VGSVEREEGGGRRLRGRLWRFRAKRGIKRVLCVSPAVPRAV